MKKLLVLAALAGFLGTQQCLAIPVQVAQTSGYYSDGGGEFTITDQPDWSFSAVYNNYVPNVTQVNGGFQTFAISTINNIPLPGPSGPLVATLGSRVGAAEEWLYWQFATVGEQLSGYDYDPSHTRAASASSMQNAFSYFAGLISFPTDPLAESFIQQAIDATDPPPGLEVDQLTLTSSDPNNPGSMTVLALVGVPDGGATLILLGLGLSSLGAFSRRFIA
jgi:hypothetical protein